MQDWWRCVRDCVLTTRTLSVPASSLKVPPNTLSVSAPPWSMNLSKRNPTCEPTWEQAHLCTGRLHGVKWQRQSAWSPVNDAVEAGLQHTGAKQASFLLQLHLQSMITIIVHTQYLQVACSKAPAHPFQMVGFAGALVPLWHNALRRITNLQTNPHILETCVVACVLQYTLPRQPHACHLSSAVLSSSHEDQKEQ